MAHASRYLQFSKKCPLRRDGTCPGGIVVSAKCADRSAFGENPCSCTALEQLSALSTTLQAEAPWTDLASAAYCTVPEGDYINFSCGYGSLRVECATVDGVRLPTIIYELGADLAGPLPPSLGDLGSSLTYLYLVGGTAVSDNSEAITSLPTEIGALTGLERLDLYGNAITSLPSELAALTGLTELELSYNQLTGLPTEFRTWGPSSYCAFYNNPGFSCANVGADTSCCTGEGLYGNNCGKDLSGGSCYTG